jgi:hypothetical protein
MTALYFTIDTEYWPDLTARVGRDTRQQNFARSIAGTTPGGAVGVGYQLDVFERCGLKAVFFVDPMPALLWGVEAIADVTRPIVERGHDVQLHLHTEWLALAGLDNPLGSRTGTYLKDFTFEEQFLLLNYARATLIAAGAPPPVAFRAGHFAANNDTLRALAKLGMEFDTSHCPGIAASACAISLRPDDRQPLRLCGVTEVPIGCIAGLRGRLRILQLTALTHAEMLAAARHAAAKGEASLTLLSHSFELLSRDRTRINHIVKRRFERLCAGLAAIPGVTSATYATHPPAVADNNAQSAPLLPHSLLRTGLRYAEQAVANALYGAR